jgi:hypothetical protein
MLIALLLALGVNVGVIFVLVAAVILRRRWLKRQPGEFDGAIRVLSGEIGGLSRKWTRGSGRWVRDVLVWTKAPLLLNNVLVPVDRLVAERPADTNEVKRLGTSPVVMEFVSDDTRFQVASRAEHGALVSRGPRSS